MHWRAVSLSAVDVLERWLLRLDRYSQRMESMVHALKMSDVQFTEGGRVKKQRKKKKKRSSEDADGAVHGYGVYIHTYIPYIYIYIL